MIYKQIIMSCCAFVERKKHVPAASATICTSGSCSLFTHMEHQLHFHCIIKQLHQHTTYEQSASPSLVAGVSENLQSMDNKLTSFFLALISVFKHCRLPPEHFVFVLTAAQNSEITIQAVTQISTRLPLKNLQNIKRMYHSHKLRPHNINIEQLVANYHTAVRVCP